MVATKGKTEAPASAAFELDKEEIESLKPKGGKTAKPSAYLAEVAQAKATGKAMGIRTTATVKGPWILGQLRKAEKELGVKLKKWNREESKGFVGFQVVADDEDENSTVTE